METAGHLGLEPKTGWYLDDRIVERSWGEYGYHTRQEQREQFPHTTRMKELEPLYTRLNGGESIIDVVINRWRDFQATLHRDHNKQKVIIVTHGEFIQAIRYHLERLTPQEWRELTADKSREVRNCAVVHYSRRNPVNGEVSNRIEWVRVIYPDKPEESPDGGTWRRIRPREQFSNKQLLRMAHQVPRLL